jgi:hypothetical protein
MRTAGRAGRRRTSKIALGGRPVAALPLHYHETAPLPQKHKERCGPVRRIAKAPGADRIAFVLMFLG